MEKWEAGNNNNNNNNNNNYNYNNNYNNNQGGVLMEEAGPGCREGQKLNLSSAGKPRLDGKLCYQTQLYCNAVNS